MNQDVAAIRRWLAALKLQGPRLIDFGGREACYVHDVGMLLARIDVLEAERAELATAPTDTMPVPGGPCEPHYIKGWNDALRYVQPVVRTAFNRCRIMGRDSRDQEQAVLDAVTTARRTAAKPGDVWDGVSG